MRRVRWLALSLALVVAVLLPAVILASYSSLSVTAGSAGDAGTSPPGWLERLNLHRAAAYLPAITEVNAGWSAGCLLHAQYMAENGVVTHSENQPNMWYSPEGHSCAKNSNVLSGALPWTDERAIDTWMQGPFHAIGMLDPRLLQTGFGSYREASAPITMAAALDILRGRESVPPSVSFPIAWPGDGQNTPLTMYQGGEFPNPLSGCPGYAVPTGLPLLLQLDPSSPPADVTDHSFMRGDEPLPHCVYDGTDYESADSNEQQLGRLVLGGRDAIVLIPRYPLVLGYEYTVSITANGEVHTWSFLVSNEPVTPGSPTPTRTLTSTPTRTHTRTPTASATPTPLTPTPTEVEATETPPPATDTPMFTVTPTEAGATETPTLATGTQVPTPTVVEPTETRPAATGTPVSTPSPAITPTRTRTPTTTSTPTQSVSNGDANCDGGINSLDALAVLQSSAGLLSNVPCPAAADVDDNGRVDALDAALILQYNAGLINVLSGRQ